MAKQRRATDDLNVALSGISSALSIMKSVDTVEQMQKLAAMAEEHVAKALDALGKIRKAAEQI